MDEMVKEFMEAFGQLPVKEDCYDLRITLIEEEAAELEAAASDLEELDALVDLAYVTYGAYYALGIPLPDPEHLITDEVFEKQNIIDIARGIDEETIDGDLDHLLMLIFSYAKKYAFESAFKEVHRSNMSKLGSNGKPLVRWDGKILKGPNYSPPNLTPYL